MDISLTLHSAHIKSNPFVLGIFLAKRLKIVQLLILPRDQNKNTIVNKLFRLKLLPSIITYTALFIVETFIDADKHE